LNHSVHVFKQLSSNEVSGVGLNSQTQRTVMTARSRSAWQEVVKNIYRTLHYIYKAQAKLL